MCEHFYGMGPPQKVLTPTPRNWAALDEYWAARFLYSEIKGLYASWEGRPARRMESEPYDKYKGDTRSSNRKTIAE